MVFAVPSMTVGHEAPLPTSRTARPRQGGNVHSVAVIVESLRAAIDCASPGHPRERIEKLVERIKVTAAGEYQIGPIPAARPLFAAAESLLLAPPDGLEPPTRTLGRCRSIH